MSNNIGEVISKLRKGKSLTQDELGKKANLNRVTIVKIEKSQRALSLEEAIRIANALETNVDAMYNYVEDTKKEVSFVRAFKAQGMVENDLSDIKRIELLVDALFAQEEIRGE